MPTRKMPRPPLAGLGLALVAVMIAAAPATAQGAAPIAITPAAMDARLRPPAMPEAERPATIAVDDDDYNWGAGWIGLAVGAGAGVVLGYALRTHTGTREEFPGLPATLGVLGGVVGFFTGLVIGN